MARRLYFYCIHRYDLIFFLRLKECLNGVDSQFRFEILLNNDLYLTSGVKSFINDFFDNVVVIPIGNYFESNFLKRLTMWLQLRFWINKKIDPNAILVSMDKSSLLSRVFIKRHKKIILIQQVEHIDASYSFSWFLFFKDVLQSLVAGSLLMKHYVHKSAGTRVRALSFFSFNKPSNIIYQVKKDFKRPSITLPTITDRAPGNKVVLFGSRFMSWSGITDEPNAEFLEKIISIYKYIAANMSADNSVHYVRHPLENFAEYELIKSIFNGELKLEKDYFSSEEFLLKNRDVTMTFSLGSTSSHSAFSMGFNSKVFYKMLRLTPSLERTYDDIFSGLPDSFFAKDFSDLLLPCVKVDEGKNMNDFLEMLAK